MKINKIINTIVPLRIFSSRNISSLGLVLLFFLLYIIAGGSIGTENLRSIKNSGINQGFGAVSHTVNEPEYLYDEQIHNGQPQIDVAPGIHQEVKKQADEITKAEENTRANADADWEKLNNKLKGIYQD